MMTNNLHPIIMEEKPNPYGNQLMNRVHNMNFPKL